MIGQNRKVLGRVLWSVHGVLALLGLGLLAAALFIPRIPRPLVISGLPRTEASSGLPVLISSGELSNRRMTRRIEGKAIGAPAKAAAPGIDSLVRLAGVMDFGGKQPAVAIIELLPEGSSKAYRSGDKVGDTGILVREISDSVVVEFESRRFRLSQTGILELPARALGSAGSDRSGN